MDFRFNKFCEGVFVRRHVKKNGKVIDAHYRSDPGDFTTNWSMIGNVNPHTGVPGKASFESAKNFQANRRQ